MSALTRDEQRLLEKEILQVLPSHSWLTLDQVLKKAPFLKGQPLTHCYKRAEVRNALNRLVLAGEVGRKTVRRHGESWRVYTCLIPF
jgi:hypothetical protein